MYLVGLIFPQIEEEDRARNGIMILFSEDDEGVGVYEVVVFWDKASVREIIKGLENDDEDQEYFSASLKGAQIPESSAFPPVRITGWAADIFAKLCEREPEDEEDEAADGDSCNESLLDAEHSSPQPRPVFVCPYESGNRAGCVLLLVWIDDDVLWHFHCFFQKPTFECFLRENRSFADRVKQKLLSAGRDLGVSADTDDVEVVGFAARYFYSIFLWEMEEERDREAAERDQEAAERFLDALPEEKELLN